MSAEKANNSALLIIMSVLGILSITLVAGLLLMQHQETPGSIIGTVLSSRQTPAPQTDSFDPISWAREGAAYPPLLETEEAQEDFIADYTGTGELPADEEIKPVIVKQPVAVSPQPAPVVKPVPVPVPAPSFQEIREMGYWVQVFSSVNAAKAESIREDLVAKGLPATVQVKKVESDTWYRVRIGAFEGENEAEHYADTVRAMRGYEASFVVQAPVTRRVPVNG